MLYRDTAYLKNVWNKGVYFGLTLKCPWQVILFITKAWPSVIMTQKSMLYRDTAYLKN